MTITAQELVSQIVKWLEDRKAEDIRVYDLQGKTSYTDFTIICSGNSSLHTRAIATQVLDKVKEMHIPHLGQEGVDNGQWILIDLYEVVIHIFIPAVREQYQIDDLFDSLMTRTVQEESVSND
jgi:ribosome-associated protein